VERLCNGPAAVGGQALATELACITDSGLLALLVKAACAHQAQQSVVVRSVRALWALGEAADRSPQLAEPVRRALAAVGARAAMQAWWVAHAGDAAVCEASIGALLRLHVFDPKRFPLGEAGLLRAGEAMAAHSTQGQLLKAGMQLWSRAVSEGSKRKRWARLLAPGERLLSCVVVGVWRHVTAAPNFPLLSSFCAVAGFLAESEAGIDALVAAGALEVMEFGMREALAAVNPAAEEDGDEEVEALPLDAQAARRYLRAGTRCAACSPAACSALLRNGVAEVLTTTIDCAARGGALLRLSPESPGAGILQEACACTTVLACAPGGDEALEGADSYVALAEYWGDASCYDTVAPGAEGAEGAAAAGMLRVWRGAHDRAHQAAGWAAWRRRRHIALLRARRSAAAAHRSRSLREAAAGAGAGAGAT
jgi:hypothetical protein